MIPRLLRRAGSAAGLISAVLLGLAACDTATGKQAEAEPPAAHAHAAEAHDHSAHAAMEAGEPSGYSIYHLVSEWRDQHGEVRALESLAGRVQVVSMLYTYCGSSCPRILADMKRIEDRLLDEHGDGVGFVLVSIDPERDTPERLLDFAEATRLDPARWTLLNGAEGDILELAAVLGINYRRVSDTDFSHSNVITVLSPTGEVAYQQLGLGSDPAPVLASIRQLLR